MRDEERRALLDEWFRAYANRVLAYLLHRTDAQTAQDVLQEVFVTAFRKAEDVPRPPLGWLFGTARRLLANRHRGNRRHDELIARLVDDAGQEADPGLAEVKEAFLQTLATLSPGDREVLTLTGWYDLTPREAAVALGTSPVNYAVRLHRARKRLAAALEEAGYRGETPAGQLAEALRG
ncbi:RNA polymerase sigma factor [uncultured Jatrophihabitans sp.]|uniref:RNA polymerase sigma factor n=1 Tax=uncultured Jatrophihabitans sp. TaxID=1610747 RepID=UPI0035CA4AA3